MSILTQYKGSFVRREYSPAIWANCNIEEAATTGSLAIWEDQFLEEYASGNRYVILEADATADVTWEASGAEGGILRMQCDTTDNMEAGIQSGTGAGWEFNTDKKMWFETIFRTNSIADNVNGIALGLFQPATLAAGWQADNTAVLADDDYVGFRTLQADGNAMEAVYLTAGGTEVAIGTAGIPIADTWHSAGWYFDGTRIYFYFDNVALDADGTLMTATDFPDTLPLTFTAGAKIGSVATLNFDLDKVRIAQEV